MVWGERSELVDGKVVDLDCEDGEVYWEDLEYEEEDGVGVIIIISVFGGGDVVLYF